MRSVVDYNSAKTEGKEKPRISQRVPQMSHRVKNTANMMLSFMVNSGQFHQKYELTLLENNSGKAAFQFITQRSVRLTAG